MEKTFTVYGEGLSQRVKIAFAFTPRISNSIAPIECLPIAFKVMRFYPNDPQSEKLEWYPEIGFSLWSKKDQGRRIDLGSNCGRVPPTHYVELTCPQEHLPPRWSPNRPSHRLQGEHMVAAHNRTSRPRDMALGFVKRSNDPFDKNTCVFHPIACYRISSGYTLYAPSSLMLQAYVVAGTRENQRLFPDDRGYPIFNEPLECDGLAMASTWKLSQTPRGKFTLERQMAVPDLEAAAIQIEQLTKHLGHTIVNTSRVDQRLAAAEDQIRVIEESHFMVYRAAQTRIPALPNLQECDPPQETYHGQASPPPNAQFPSSAVSQPLGVKPPTFYNVPDVNSVTNRPLSSYQSELQWSFFQRER